MTAFATTQRLLLGAAMLLLPALVQAQAVHDTGPVQFEVFADGNLGTTPPNPYPGTGFVFDGGASDLFTASFVVGASLTQVSGNYYGGGTTPPTEEWVTISGPTELTGPFDEPFGDFDQAFEAVYDDSGAPNPIGLEVTQRSYSADGDPFVILEFEIANTSGGDLTGLYPGIFADWDVGGAVFEENLGGYDEATGLQYVWDPTGATDNYFGVTSLGDATVSGVVFDALGGTETDVEIYQFLTTILPAPDDEGLGADRRNTLGVGPYDIATDESITVYFAFVGGSSEGNVIANAAVANVLFSGPLEEAVHDTGEVQLEVFADGHIGAYAIEDQTSFGTGFVFDGENGLYEAQLLVGLSPNQVSGQPYSIPNEAGLVEWMEVEPLTVAAPPEGADQAFSATFDDSSAPNPIGVTAMQLSYSSEGDAYVTVDYTIENTSGGDLSQVYVGIFADWDVGEFASNLAGFDEDTGLLYVYDDSGTVTNYYGVAALDEEDVTGVAYDALPGDDVLYAALVSIAPEPTVAEDRRTVLGVGPYDIAAGESVTVSFAFVGGEDLDDIIANANELQGNPVAVEETTQAGTFRLESAYPNPVSGTAHIAFTLPKAQQVSLTVYDMLGRRVATLVDGVRQEGAQTVAFDASSLPSGVYVYRLVTGETQLAERFTVTR